MTDENNTQTDFNDLQSIFAAKNAFLCIYAIARIALRIGEEGVHIILCIYAIARSTQNRRGGCAHNLVYLCNS